MKKLNKTCSDDSQNAEYVAVGRVTGPRGLKGEVKVKIISNVSGRFQYLDVVSVEYKNGNIEDYEVVYTKNIGKAVVIKFTGVDDRNGAEVLSGAFIRVHRESVAQLEDDSYYIFDLEGMEVFDAGNAKIGTVTLVETMPANDLIYIENESEEIIVPAVKDFITGIDTQAKRMTVKIPEGLPRYPKKK